MTRICLLLSFMLIFHYGNAKEPLQPAMIEKVIPDFILYSYDGSIYRTVDLRDDRGLIVVFTCNHCPFAQLYSERFNQLNVKYTRAGIPFIAINPMDSVMYENETLAGMKLKAETDQFNFPYLRDADQKVAALFHATHTPEVYILWKENDKWVVRYHGAIDDNGEHPENANSFVEKAIDQLLKGEKVEQPETKSFGCKIYYRN